MTPIRTPFLEVPGLLTGECRRDHGRDYLAISIHPSPSGRRTSAIVGDVVVDGHVLKDWGLHLIDMNLTMGNLLDVVRAKGATYLAAGRP